MPVDSRVKQAQKNERRAERRIANDPILTAAFQSSRASGPLAEKMFVAAERAAERIRKEETRR